MTGDAGLTQDGFLDGRLKLWQPKAGYRAGTDPVFLAAATPAKGGESVLELGCGVGTAALCLGWRVQVALTGIERNSDYADLARRNAEANGIGMEVVTGDIDAMPDNLRSQSFDHVIANPPYFPSESGTSSRDDGREAANREDTPLGHWVEAGVRRLKPRGWLTFIQRADRLQDLLTALDERMGDISILPLIGRAGTPAGRIILRARKGARAPLRLLPPVVLHQGDHHASDSGDPSEVADSILRQGRALPLPDWVG